MKTAELTKLTYEELREKLDETKEELFNLRFQLATNQLDNTARMGQVKKDIARIRTVMAQQEIATWHRQQEDN
jgi:large subunit ribosomal protein L29